MGGIAEKLTEIKKSLDDGVTLVAVSKTKPPEDILEAYSTGHMTFGENKVQELVYKHETLPKDIEWHMIGHLQANKVKYIAPFVSLIHSVDSLKLLRTINKEAIKNNRIINCLLQVKIAAEISKFGLGFDELVMLIESPEFAEFENIRVVGLMGMATFTDSEEQVRQEFKRLKSFFKRLKENQTKNNSYFSEISMGMSGDYRIALEEGSTMVRVGSSIFGERVYH